MKNNLLIAVFFIIMFSSSLPLQVMKKMMVVVFPIVEGQYRISAALSEYRRKFFMFPGSTNKWIGLITHLS